MHSVIYFLDINFSFGHQLLSSLKIIPRLTNNTT